jgi:hypothetical protein
VGDFEVAFRVKLTQTEYLYPACYSWSKATRDLLVVRYQAP